MPSKLTPERGEKIIALIRAGNYKETAAACCGIDQSTLYRWVENGEKAGDGEKDPNKDYREFYKAVKEAEAYAEAAHLSIIAKAAQGHTLVAKKTTTTTKPDGSTTVREEEAYQPPQWTASAWYLERTKRDKFIRREKLSGDKENPLEVNVNATTDIDRFINDPEAVDAANKLLEVLGRSTADTGGPGMDGEREEV